VKRMQTKRQIQELLASAGVRPAKHLGQHFLIDLNLMRLLVDSACITAEDVVLEIGCGTGSLTEALAERAGSVVAVEVDRTLAEIARKRLAKAPNVEIINTDALENKNTISPIVTEALLAACKRHMGRAVLVANLPYSAGSPVILNLAGVPGKIAAMYVTVQKEVADRMTATPGSSDYGTLSIILAATGDVRRIRVLKPGVFWPRPQVDSAMVGYVHSKAKSGRIENWMIFAETVRLFMGHRRKTLLACTKLAAGKLAQIANWPEIFELCGVDPKHRPEQLGPEDYIAVANRCSTNLKDR